MLMISFSSQTQSRAKQFNLPLEFVPLHKLDSIQVISSHHKDFHCFADCLQRQRKLHLGILLRGLELFFYIRKRVTFFFLSIRLTTSVLTASRPLCHQPIRGLTRRFWLTRLFFVWLFFGTIFLAELFNSSIGELRKAGDLPLTNSFATQCTTSSPGTQVVL